MEKLEISHLVAGCDDEHMLISHVSDGIAHIERWGFSHNDVSAVVDRRQFAVHVNVFDGRTPTVVGCGYRSNLQGLLIFSDPIRLCLALEKLIVKLGQHLWMSVRKSLCMGMDIGKHVRLDDLPVLAIAIAIAVSVAVAVSASASATLARV